MKQVERSHYQFGKYCDLARWSSYYFQLREVLLLEPKEVLEVGVGDAVFKSYLQKNTAIQYTNLDIADDLEPDILGNVTKIPLADNSFDAVVAFEVLEHIPFEQFDTALSELHRVSRKNVVLSLPHFGPPVKFLFKIPFLKEIKMAFKFNYPQEHFFQGEHYWEIGKKDYSLERILTCMRKYFIVQEDFVPFENQYHHFFVLEKK